MPKVVQDLQAANDAIVSGEQVVVQPGGQSDGRPWCSIHVSCKHNVLLSFVRDTLHAKERAQGPKAISFTVFMTVEGAQEQLERFLEGKR